MSFEGAYTQLNEQQKAAVDAIEGPVLVIAGPGTGKTQLLSTRVANIMKVTGTAPSNILCLTFTDSAARNMRERLVSVVGQPGYHVMVHTFHSFGVDIINQYPDHFTRRPLLQPTDELGTYQIVRELFEQLPHNNPLNVKVGDEYIFLRDTLSIISWLKHNALLPAEALKILKANETFIEHVTPIVQKTFHKPTSGNLLPAYQKLATTLQQHTTTDELFGFASYGHKCVADLLTAIEQTKPGRYAPAITAWRNTWLEKDHRGMHRFKDAAKASRKMRAVITVYADLQAAMAKRGLYDFDDMILEVVHALEQSEELRLNLQERYLYILVDEFQDTNKAQLRILRALGDNPIFENKPNIMVVGDDDQAIYAFQGAEASNMVQFAEEYEAVSVITLGKNYRSTQTILDASQVIAEQVEQRISNLLPGINKILEAQVSQPLDELEHSLFASELQQYQWIADRIKQYIAEGHRPDDIAVIAPKHRYLERLMPYVAQARVPVAYERRENILEAPILRQLIRMAELTEAIASHNHDVTDALLAEVLSYPFWDIPAEELVELSVACATDYTHWLPCLLKHPNKQLAAVATWLLEGANQSHTEPLEYILDRFLGITDREVIDDEHADAAPQQASPKKPTLISPMKEYYFSSHRLDNAADEYLALLGQLSTVRQRLRTWKPDQTLYLHDLVEFVELHRQAHIKIIDTNPHTQTTNAVQVMTAYKAKGLEFGIVFVINAQDEVWGSGARVRTSRIRLPQNLPIKPTGETVDDRRRLFFVALTRAKHSLHITSYTHTLDNKLSLSLSFLANERGEEPAHPAFKPQLMPTSKAIEAVEILSTDWAYRYRQVLADKPTLFEPILKDYYLSVTHINNFIDIVNAGPDYFFIHNLLKFPEAMTPHAAYGDAIHRCLQWVYGELKNTGRLPTVALAIRHFKDLLARKHLPKFIEKQFAARGEEALHRYLKARRTDFETTHIIERSFRHEGVIIGGARLSGKIDKIVPLESGYEVIDFKTGKPAHDWQGKDEYEKLKLYKYKQQLMFYKLLIEHSATYGKRGQVQAAALAFIEANDEGELVEPLELNFEASELTRFSQLIVTIWYHIQSLNFPDTSAYTKDLKGVLGFEEDLIAGKI